MFFFAMHFQLKYEHQNPLACVVGMKGLYEDWLPSNFPFNDWIISLSSSSTNTRNSHLKLEFMRHPNLNNQAHL